jgi:nucleoside-diphosphate-sugar epimerase
VDPETTGVWLLSPGKVIEAFVRACELPSSTWGVNRVLNLPGITVSVKEMLEALRRVGGEQVARRVTYVPDARIQAIVRTWPVRFRTDRALAMGFGADSDFDSVIRAYIRDEGIAVR